MKQRAVSFFGLSLLASCLALSASVRASAQQAGDFASHVVAYSNLGGSVYGDPNAVLGKPTLWIRDPSYPAQPIASSLIYGAWNVAPDSSHLITTLGNSRADGSITVEFETPLYDDPANWYGMDFIVYGNAFFLANGSATPAANMDTLTLGNGVVTAEPVTISVSPDGSHWYTYATPTADNYYPTQAFAWDHLSGTWGVEQDWHKPVPPSVRPADFAGRTAASAIALYDGSAGGTAFDLHESGFPWIRYIRAVSRGGEIDGFSRVYPRTAAVSGTVLLEGIETTAPAQTITFEFRPEESLPTFSRTADITPEGSFSLQDIPRRRYTVRVKGAKWLADRTVLDVSGGDVSEQRFVLRAGDANNDNSADALDLAVLIEGFNSQQGEALYNPDADFNVDGSVDALDLALLIGNFNVEGEP